MSHPSDTFQKMLRQLRQSFLEEIPERLDHIERILLQIEKSGGDSEQFHELYRRIHSLKGSGGTHGLHIITTICHHLEDILNRTNTGEQFPAKLINLCVEHLDLLRAACKQLHHSEADLSDIEQRLSRLQQSAAQARFSALLIDDSKATSIICQQLLAQHNVSVITIHDGLHGLTLALTEPFDLLISNYEVPVLNGKALIAAIKLSGLRYTRQLPCILITSNPTLICATHQSIDPDLTILKNDQLIPALDKAISYAIQKKTA